MPDLVPPDPPLTDGHVALTPPRSEDVAAMRAIRSEDDIRRRMGWDGEPPPDDAEALRNIERALASWDEGMWAVFRIVEVESDEIVGGANLGFSAHEIAEVSYYLAASARGRGHATRAVKLLTRWAFDDVGSQRVELRTELDNEASIRVAERAGFTREGIERASRAFPDGSRFDSVLFSLLPND